MRLGWILAAAGAFLVLAASKASGEVGAASTQPVRAMAGASNAVSMRQAARLTPAERKKYGPAAEALTPPEVSELTRAWLTQWRKRLVPAVMIRPVRRVDALSEVLGVAPLAARQRQFRMLVTVANRSAYRVRFVSSSASTAAEAVLAEGLGRIAPWRTGAGFCRMPLAAPTASETTGAAPISMRRTTLNLPLSVTWSGSPAPSSRKHAKVLRDLELRLLLTVRLTESRVSPGQFLTEAEFALPHQTVLPAPEGEVEAGQTASPGPLPGRLTR